MSETAHPRDAVDATVVRALHRLARTPTWCSVALSVALTVIVLGLDWWAGPTTSILLGYSITVPLVAWMFSTRWPAIAVALLVSAASGALILLADDNLVATGVVCVNTLFRAASLVLLAVIVSAFRRHLLLTEWLARVDALTGVASRRSILAELDVAIAQAQYTGVPASIVYFDLDDLKAVNDHLGHQAGDNLIRQFTSCVVLGSRLTDHLGRLGGDEFLLVCPMTDRAEATQVVDRIRDCAGVPNFSWGIATGGPGSDAEEMVARADEQMYASKHRVLADASAPSDSAKPSDTRPSDQPAGAQKSLLPLHARRLPTSRPGRWAPRPTRRTSG